jgi:hypothetical protein
LNIDDPPLNELSTVVIRHHLSIRDLPLALEGAFVGGENKTSSALLVSLDPWCVE